MATIQGVIHGRTIELEKEPGLPDGQAVAVTIERIDELPADLPRVELCIRPAIPPEVQEFAAEKGVSRFLNVVIDLARQAFPSSTLCMSIGQDAEDEMHQYIALDVEVSDQGTEELLAGQRIWSAGIRGVCPSRQAVYFVLGWR